MTKTSNKPKIIVVVGPTASGKSDLAVNIAQQHNGEIISADSRQVYRGFNLSSGKITSAEMRGVPHHMLDVVNPMERMSAGQYANMAKPILFDVLKRHKTPVICGGTGFYIQALLEDNALPSVPANAELRRELSQKNTQELYAILQKKDPARAQTIEPKNPHRLIRAIEIANVLGHVPQLSKKSNLYDTLYIGIKIQKELLDQRIRIRLKERFDAGLVKEIKKLHDEGVTHKRLDELGLEFRYVSRFLQNELNYNEMITQLEFAIIHYAKRQMTWLKRNKRIQWVSPSTLNQTEQYVTSFLGNCSRYPQ